MWMSLFVLTTLVGQAGVANHRPAVIEPSAPDVVVVCPGKLRPGLDRWLDYRSSQGHRPIVLPVAPQIETTVAAIREAARSGRLQYVVVIGDAPCYSAEEVDWSRVAPTGYAKAEVNVHWGSPPHIATDNPFGDLDGDGLPELAVGRIPADTVDEVRMVLDKTIAYERSVDFGAWRRRLNFVAGVGDFGLLIDAIIESITKRLLVGRIPPHYELTMTHASYRSPYCPGASQFRAATIDRLNEGCLFWVYMGHGQPFGLDYVRTAQGDYPIFESGDLPALACKRAWPIAVFFACYTGAVDAVDDCLAERMVLSERGPVAAYAASRVSMPYAMSVMGSELIDALTSDQYPTLGRAIVEAKRRMVEPTAAATARLAAGGQASILPVADEKSATTAAADLRARLDSLAEAFRSDHYDPEAERREHVLLFNLLGDPMLRLPIPPSIDVEASVQKADAGSRRLVVLLESPLAGTATIELVVPRDRLTFDPPARTAMHRDRSDLFARTYAETYARANARQWAATKVHVAPGRLRVALDIPPETSGPCVVRVFVEGPRSCAAGACEVEIEPPRVRD